MGAFWTRAGADQLRSKPTGGGHGVCCGFPWLATRFQLDPLKLNDRWGEHKSRRIGNVKNNATNFGNAKTFPRGGTKRFGNAKTIPREGTKHFGNAKTFPRERRHPNLAKKI